MSTTLIIGFDKAKDQDVSCLTVSKYNGSKLKSINSFTGLEAENLYSRLVFGVPIMEKNDRADLCDGYYGEDY